MKRIILFILLLAVFTFSGCDIGNDNNENIIINEVCTSNKSCLATANYKYYDWIEIYNPTDVSVNLKNYGLSDKQDKLYRFKFPSLLIKSKQYIIIYFEKDYTGSEKNIADFGLSDKGETLYLTMPNGTTIAKVEVPSLKEDTTYGRHNGEFKILNPSPLKDNESVPVYKHIENPVFSHESGFYDYKQELIHYPLMEKDSKS